MNSYYPTSYDTNTNTLTTTIFNTDEFESNYGYVTQGEIKNYANLYNSNIFFNTNQFTDIFVNSLNGITSTTLGFLTDITQDVGMFMSWTTTNLNNVISSLTNLSYNSVNNITSLIGLVYLENPSTPNNMAITGNLNVGNNINTSFLNTFQTFSNSVVSNSITTNSLVCSNLHYNNDIGCYLYVITSIPQQGQSYTNTLLTIPLMKSQTASNLFTIGNSFTGAITLKPNYSISFTDTNGYILYSLSNTTNDFMYNKSISFSGTVSKINLYLNNNMLN
jgi:hypothetical protein